MSDDDTQCCLDFTEELKYSGKTGKAALKLIKKSLSNFAPSQPSNSSNSEAFIENINNILNIIFKNENPELNMVIKLKDTWHYKEAINYLLGLTSYDCSEEEISGYYEGDIYYPEVGVVCYLTRLDGLVLNSSFNPYEDSNLEKELKEIESSVGYLVNKIFDYYKKEIDDLISIWKSGSHNKRNEPQYYWDWAKEKKQHYLPLLKAYPDGLNFTDGLNFNNDKSETKTTTSTLKKEDVLVEFNPQFDEFTECMYDLAGDYIEEYNKEPTVESLRTYIASKPMWRGEYNKISYDESHGELKIGTKTVKKVNFNRRFKRLLKKNS